MSNSKQDVVTRLRAELDLARSWYSDNKLYVEMLENFVKLFETSNVKFNDMTITYFALILREYVEKGFRFTPIGLSDNNFPEPDENNECRHYRCRDIIKKYSEGINNKNCFIIKYRKPISILVTNEYYVKYNKLVKKEIPTERFNGDSIDICISKGGIIDGTYIRIDSLKNIDITQQIEPLDLKVRVPAIMIDDEAKNRIIFAVDHKCKALEEIASKYNYHYEKVDGIYYNIRNRTFKY